MSGTLAEFKRLVNAEDYFTFFDLPFDPTIVNVNRLHILQKFSQLVKELDPTDWSEAETLDRYRSALQSAYDLFLGSTGVEQKLFKVFKEKPQNVVLLSEIGAD